MRHLWVVERRKDDGEWLVRATERGEEREARMLLFVCRTTEPEYEYRLRKYVPAPNQPPPPR